MANKIPNDQIKAREVIHTSYVPSQYGKDSECIFIKEKLHLVDGSIVDNFLTVRDFKRNFWITKPGHRKHDLTKEWEDKRKVDSFSCTQNTLVKAVCRVLRKNPSNEYLRSLGNNPYVYGTDIHSTVLIKKHYMDKWPDLLTRTNYAALDIETNMHSKEGEIITGGLTLKDRALLVATKDFLGTTPDVKNRVHGALHEYLNEYVESRGIKLDFRIVDTPLDIIKTLIGTLHEWKPDFVLIWNIDFEFTKFKEEFERSGVDPKFIFSDPSVPREFQYYEYKQGKKRKTTARGLETSINPPDQWHTVFAPAQFYFIDPMCIYKKLRVTESQEPSYSLDAILRKELNLSKLKFKEADMYGGADWHKIMQKQFKIEYMIYNVFDCIGLELLEDKNNDIAGFRMNCGFSDYVNFPSTPKRLTDDLHFFALENDMVIGSSGNQIAEIPDNNLTLGPEQWVVTLPSHLCQVKGMKPFIERPDVRVNFFTHISDIDVSSGYPSNGLCLNLSTETMVKEVCKIEGVDEAMLRQTALNLTAPIENATEIAINILGMPDYGTLLENFKTDKGMH